MCINVSTTIPIILIKKFYRSDIKFINTKPNSIIESNHKQRCRFYHVWEHSNHSHFYMAGNTYKIPTKRSSARKLVSGNASWAITNSLTLALKRQRVTLLRITSEKDRAAKCASHVWILWLVFIFCFCDFSYFVVIFICGVKSLMVICEIWLFVIIVFKKLWYPWDYRFVLWLVLFLVYFNFVSEFFLT